MTIGFQQEKIKNCWMLNINYPHNLELSTLLSTFQQFSTTAFFHTLLEMLKTCWKNVDKLKVLHIFLNNLSTLIQHFNTSKSFQLFHIFSTIALWKTLRFKKRIYDFPQVFHSFNTPYYYYYFINILFISY